MNEIIENKITFEKLVDILKEVVEGKYKTKNIEIFVNRKKIYNHHTEALKVLIKKDELIFNISVPNDYGYIAQISFSDEESILNINRSNYISSNNYIYVHKNDFNYYIYPSIILKRNQNTNEVVRCNLHTNTLITAINQNCSIGYNIDNDKIYVYFKLHNKYNNNYEEDYFKTEYNDDYKSDIDIFNKRLIQYFEKMAKFDRRPELGLYIKSIITPCLDKEIDDKVEELKELSRIYKKYSNKVNMHDNEELIKEIYDFALELSKNPIDAKINNLSYIINNENIKDQNVLKKLEKEIRIIKKNNPKKILRNK